CCWLGYPAPRNAGMKSEGPEKVPAPGSRRGVSKLHEGISSHCWCELSDRVAPKTTAQRVMGWFEFSQCSPCLRGDFLSRTDSPRRTRRTQRTETLQIKAPQEGMNGPIRPASLGPIARKISQCGQPFRPSDMGFLETG